MAFSSLVLLPLYSILIACCTFFTLLYVICRQKQNYLNEQVDSFVLKVQIAEQEVEEQIDSRLNAIIAGFKAQIPMISMFLSKSKESELKEIAKTELMKLIPDLKERFIQKILGASEMSMPFTEQLNFQATQLVDHLWKQIKYLLLLIAVGVGFVLGILEVVLIYYVF